MPESPKRKLSTESYKGVRDFYPEDMFVLNYITGIMRETAEKFGYLEYGASILEPAELYEAKSNEEIVSEQTYTFTDRGERKVTLRPEMTPTLARMVAARRRDLALPTRLYSIPNVFRYERPQRGRLREHWQLNCDIFGVPGIEAETEIITIADAIMKAFGAKQTDYEIRVNSRKLMEETYGPLLRNREEFPILVRLLDRKDKIEKAVFDDEWNKLATEPFRELSIDGSPLLTRLIAELKAQGVVAKFDPYLARGFDYYTDIVFEVFDTSPENSRALFGGGRYDGLLEIFDVEPIPAIGFGMGDVRIRDFLETHELLPAYVPTTDLFIGTFDLNFIREAQLLAKELREKGLSVAVNLMDRKVGDQIKSADKQKIPFVLVVGETEKTTGNFKLKHLGTGEEKDVKRNDIADTVFSFIG